MVASRQSLLGELVSVVVCCREIMFGVEQSEKKSNTSV